MASYGNVEKKTLVVEETEIQWTITDFFSLVKKNEKEGIFWCMKSPVFHFRNDSWYIEIYPNCNPTMEFISLYLHNDGVREYSVDYNFGLKKKDGSVEFLMKGILERDQDYNQEDEAKFIKGREVRQRKFELVPFGILTVTGRLKIVETGSSIELSPVLSKHKVENLIKLDTLSKNLKDLLVNTESCDTTLRVQEKVYKAHRALLIARSSVFAAMFLHETSEKLTGIVDIPDCDPESFGEFLKFLYCAKLEKPSSNCVLHLYETSDKYAVQELKTFCVEYLIESLTVENVCDVVALADKYEETNLLNAAQGFFNENANKILQTAEWDYLVKNYYRLSKRLLIEMTSK